MHIGKCAPTDAELDPPLADVVQAGYLFGDAHRISQGEDMDRQTNPNVLGAGRQGAGDGYRRGEDPASMLFGFCWIY